MTAGAAAENRHLRAQLLRAGLEIAELKARIGHMQREIDELRARIAKRSEQDAAPERSAPKTE